VAEYVETEVLVIGGGIAGATSALILAEKGIRVVLISKVQSHEDTNTYWAQGGIARQHTDEPPETFVEDILKSGARMNYLPAVHQVVEDSGPAVKEILVDKLKIPFSLKNNEEPDLAREGAHSTRRVLHVKDKTGQEIQSAFSSCLSRLKNLTILYNHMAVDLLSYPHHSTRPSRMFEPPQVVGAYVLTPKNGKIIRIFARKVILATGGLSSIYLHSTNPDDAVGNGIAMAYRLGARLTNLEYIQFHPTSLYHHETTHFLISEAVRGEGARLMNRGGELFMEKYSELKDLAPRDVVSRAIFEEMLEGHSDYVLLNIADHVQIDIRDRFPTIYKKCLEYNLDIEKEPIPVVPAAHYSCGGVWVDLRGRTSIRNLYAIGEVSATGVHGANRLASVSLLEGLVWGRQVARDILQVLAGAKVPYTVTETPRWRYPAHQESIDPALVKQDRIVIKYTMWNYSGIIRTEKRLNRAKSDLAYLKHRIEKFYREARMDKRIVDLRDGVQTAFLVAHAALLNQESHGAHYRVD